MQSFTSALLAQPALSPLWLCFLSKVRHEEKALLAATSRGEWPALFLRSKSRPDPQLIMYISSELGMSELASLHIRSCHTSFHKMLESIACASELFRNGKLQDSKCRSHCQEAFIQQIIEASGRIQRIKRCHQVCGLDQTCAAQYCQSHQQHSRRCGRKPSGDGAECQKRCIYSDL